MARTKRTNRSTDSTAEVRTQIPLEPEAQAVLDQLEQQRVTLEFRLRKGEEVIAAARTHGEDVVRWEAQWVNLLNEYEQVSFQIEQLLELATRAGAKQVATPAA